VPTFLSPLHAKIKEKMLISIYQRCQFADTKSQRRGKVNLETALHEKILDVGRFFDSFE
jgi:hypothetical protein